MGSGVGWPELEKMRPSTFTPGPIYDSDADTLTLFISEDESYRERVDSLLTIYRSFSNNEVVGCHIKGVNKILKAVHAFDIGIHSKEVTIGLLLMGLPWTLNPDGPGEIVSKHYFEVVQPIAKSFGAQTITIPNFSPSHAKA